MASEVNRDEHQVSANGVFNVVMVRLSNQSRGRDQRAGSVAVYLVDSRGKSYGISPRGQKAYERQIGSTLPLTSTLIVGQPIKISQVFDLPKDSCEVSMTVEHPIGFAGDFYYR